MISDLLTQENILRLRQLVDESDNIVIVGHQNPDGDAVGAILAFSQWLQLFDKKPLMVLPDAYPDNLQWLPLASEIIRFDKRPEQVKEVLESAELVVCLDFNMYSRVGDLQQILYDCKARFLHIDHHIGHDIDSEWSVLQEGSSSTCELVYKVVRQCGDLERLDNKFFDPIFTGIMTDTGSFEYSSANAETFCVASELLAHGVDKVRIRRNIYDTYSHWRLQLEGYVIYCKLVVFPQQHASYFTLTKEELKRFHFIKGDADGLVNIPLHIKGHKLSISLREDTIKPNLIWVSTRSIDNVPCNKICEKYFNGGGHKNASGGRLYCSMEEAKKIAEKVIKEYENLI